MFPTFHMKETTLSVTGDRGLLDPRRCVAIVGSRAASGRGMGMAMDLARAMAQAGWVVASGGAVGIDAAAHRGALAAGGPTVAVVAGGTATPYPERHRELFAEIVARGGALVSPFGVSTPPRRWHFVRRNGLLAELAFATVVVEAGARSGSLHTAVAAHGLGRLVAACPGTPGADALLREGAALVESPADLLAALGGTPRRPAIAAPGDALETTILQALTPGAHHGAEAIAERAGLTLRETLRGLSALEAAGLAIAAPGGAYRRAMEGH